MTLSVCRRPPNMPEGQQDTSTYVDFGELDQLFQDAFMQQILETGTGLKAVARTLVLEFFRLDQFDDILQTCRNGRQIDSILEGILWQIELSCCVCMWDT